MGLDDQGRVTNWCVRLAELDPKQALGHVAVLRLAETVSVNIAEIKQCDRSDGQLVDQRQSFQVTSGALNVSLLDQKQELGHGCCKNHKDCQCGHHRDKSMSSAALGQPVA
jgi:hypothetical protein